MREGFQKIVLRRKSAQHGVAERDAVGGIDVAEGRSRILGFHGYALQHDIHIELHEACDQLFPVNEELPVPDRYDDDDLFIRGIHALDRYFRFGDGLRIKGVVVDLFPDALVGCIDQSVRIHEGEAVQAEELFHIPLVGAHVIQVAHVLVGYHADSYIDDADIVVQVVGDDLFPAPCQFVQVQKAH